MGRHREFNDEAVLDSAMELFWKNGYEGTSYEDLSNATGVARPGLYRTFGNKYELYQKALHRYDEQYGGFIKEAFEQPSSYELVRTYLYGSTTVHTQHPSHPGCMRINGAIACSDDAEVVRVDLADRRKLGEDKLRSRLERAREEGELPASTDCAALAGLVMAVAQGMAIQAKSGASREHLQTIIEQFLLTWPKK